MANHSAQGSITIKRLRNGDTLFLTLQTNGIPLYQGVDKQSNRVAPDWTVAANQPEITPVANSVRGNGVTLSNHTWYYNSNQVPLNFNGAVDGDWTTDSTGKFKLNGTTGALRIIANLASSTNYSNDTLIYRGTATVAGIEYSVEKSIDILIQQFGSNSYMGFIIADTEQLTSTVTSTKLSTQLWQESKINDYYPVWYKDDTLWSAKNGQKEITVGLSDVDGTQLFICKFFLNQSDTDPVAVAGIRIIDTQDDFQVVCYISSTNKEVFSGQNGGVTVAAKIINQRTNTEITPASPTWRMDVMKKSDWSVLKTAAANTIVVTTTETDSGGQENDVEVMAEVTWSD